MKCVQHDYFDTSEQELTFEVFEDITMMPKHQNIFFKKNKLLCNTSWAPNGLKSVHFFKNVNYIWPNYCK